jgi:hypothetical protein
MHAKTSPAAAAPTGRGQEGRCRIVAHRSDEVKVVRSARFRVYGSDSTNPRLQPPEALLEKRSYFTVFEGNGSGLSGVVCGARMEEGGSRRGRHVDFVVYAGVWSRGLFECGSRDDGTRGAAAPAPVNPALVNIETWRDLSSGRPRAARIVFAESAPPRRLIASRVVLAERIARERGPITTVRDYGVPPARG